MTTADWIAERRRIRDRAVLADEAMDVFALTPDRVRHMHRARIDTYHQMPGVLDAIEAVLNVADNLARNGQADIDSARALLADGDATDEGHAERLRIYGEASIEAARLIRVTVTDALGIDPGPVAPC
ncbi:MAG: hypothetical protein IPJ61_17755 [Tessaracoccus sp.]|uniref:hypothetical protein n=1 Tax=Tessaracoccus sp. TaxID=1971211 RepID=UPI001EBEB77A|nr:hypothetical protein [Tessaracoccus sp.]MBK7822850.1 hypothetical protein [Tessaracoccus sp.]